MRAARKKKSNSYLVQGFRPMSQQDILLYIMTVFVVVSAIALCVQMGTMLAMYKAVQKLQQEATSVMPQVKSILTKAEDTVDQSKRHIIEITAKGNEMMDLGRAQLAGADRRDGDCGRRFRPPLRSDRAGTGSPLNAARRRSFDPVGLLLRAEGHRIHRVEPLCSGYRHRSSARRGARP